MAITHPMQDERVKVIDGQHAGRQCKVVRVLMDHGAHGFAEVEFDKPKGAKGKPDRDLVPLPYLDRAGVTHE
ncbi:KOW motif-containing protein [Paraburkholderia sp. BR14263]|uniref:KOW motif-containing protein n=1 Tax=unclassified Paraburkholderia TaxID=2615204 RepID=UPI0034CF0A08